MSSLFISASVTPDVLLKLSRTVLTDQLNNSVVGNPIGNACNWILMGTGFVDGPSVLMEVLRGQYKHHNKQSNDSEENKGWFAILLLQLLQLYGGGRQGGGG